MIEFIIFIVAAVVVVFLLKHFGARLLRWVDECIESFRDHWKLLLLAAFCFAGVAAGPRIENLNIRHEANGCIFASFDLSGDGDRGNYYLMWCSPEFVLPNYWIPVTRIEYAGPASYNVALYTNFSCANLRLEKIQ